MPNGQRNIKLVTVDGLRCDSEKPAIGMSTPTPDDVLLTDIEIPPYPHTTTNHIPLEPESFYEHGLALNAGRVDSGVGVVANHNANNKQTDSITDPMSIMADAVFRINIPNSLVDVSGADSFVRILDPSCTVVYGNDITTPAVAFEDLVRIIRRLTTRLERVDGISQETRQARQLVSFHKPLQPNRHLDEI